MRILIVDNEPGVAAGLAKWLTDGGWGQPGVVTNSDEAVEWINQNGGKIDVLISEALIQPVDGPTLREALLPYMPKMKAVFFSAQDISGYGERIAGCAVLPKPVNGPAIEDAIRDLYEPKPAATPQPTAVAPKVATATPVASATPRAVAATPTATPVATATPRAVAATPVATATPAVTATPTPTATPTATPRAVAATPTATPAATPRAVAATPVATPTPTATPVAAATPVATPAPVATAAPTPVATPAATPRAVATPAPAQPVSTAAQVVARPVAATASPVQATPAQARPVQATPKAAVAKAAVPAATPVAAARPAAVAAVPAAARSNSEMELPPDDLVGATIGDYLIEAKIGEGSQGGIYRATQAKMRRQVRFYTLDRARAQDPAEIQRFIANASMKANVSHPSIFAVYEAGESNGIYFYSCEYVPCRSLHQLRAAGQLLDENTALQAMKTTSEVLGYFAQQNVTHNIISENAILIGPHNRPRVANTAVYQAREAFDMQGEMARLGAVIASVLPENSEALGIRQLAVLLAIGQQTFPNWPALTQAVAALEPKIAPQDAYKLDAQERAAIRMVEEAKKKQKRSMIISSAVSLTLLAVALVTVWFFVFRQKGATVRDLEAMEEIPAGEFIYQQGEKVNLPTFYIDRYEVTIGQYAQFLEYLKEHPEEAEKFAHPTQPKGKKHVPEGWADMTEIDPPNPGYYSRAKQFGKYQNIPLDVNSPVFGVDWYDAYAYAKWKGKRLPTEQEWEKAARGTNGNIYPWGNTADPKKANTGQDFQPQFVKGGTIDGWPGWAPVDAISADKSPFKVYGMAGNVGEWTATFDVDPKMPSSKLPVIRGGNWRTKDYNLDRRVLALPPGANDMVIGFRTASDTPPAKK
jgi:formylglycine-generating enzyme required for sulfatase activity/DNA-binding NarL/FixJ family response regulator